MFEAFVWALKWIAIVGIGGFVALFVVGMFLTVVFRMNEDDAVEAAVRIILAFCGVTLGRVMYLAAFGGA